MSIKSYMKRECEKAVSKVTDEAEYIQSILERLQGRYANRDIVLNELSEVIAEAGERIDFDHTLMLKQVVVSGIANLHEFFGIA